MTTKTKTIDDKPYARSTPPHPVLPPPIEGQPYTDYVDDPEPRRGQTYYPKYRALDLNKDEDRTIWRTFYSLDKWEDS